MLALITAGPPTLMAFAALWAAYITGRRNEAMIHKLHIEINSRLTELMKAEKATSRAEGVVAGRAENH